MEKKQIAQLKLHTVKPTTFNIKLMPDWVVWQFPQKCAKEKGYCGAVHPPLAKHGWFPAIIYPGKNEAQIHGHLPETFETPELAANHFSPNSK